MVLTEKDKAFIKNLYLIKDYRQQRFMTGLPGRGWNRSGLNKLFAKPRKTGTSKAQARDVRVRLWPCHRRPWPSARNLGVVARCSFLRWLSVDFLQKTINDFIMVHMPRNDCITYISKGILLYKLPLQSAMLGLGLGLGLKAKIFGLGLEAKVLALALYVVALLTSLTEAC